MKDRTPRIPNAFVVGAPKCGTTALVHYLEEHPSILFSKPKEPHYFATDLEGFRGYRKESRYLSLFSHARKCHRILGEGSTWYLYSRAAVPNILEFNPEARLIVMVRNPVEMAYSLHAQVLHSLDETIADFEEAWALQKKRRSGFYVPPACRHPALLMYRRAAMLGEQMERLLSIAPRDQVHVIVFDDFVADTRAVYEETLEFLGVESDGREKFPKVNPRTRRRLRPLAKLLERPPAGLVRSGRLIRRKLGLDTRSFWFSIRMAGRGLTSTVEEKEPLSEDFRIRLKRTFATDVKRLSGVLDRDLTHWCEE